VTITPEFFGMHDRDTEGWADTMIALVLDVASVSGK
jgi:hypothetical protein